MESKSWVLIVSSWTIVAAAIAPVGLSGCSSDEKSANQFRAADGNRPLVDDKYKLSDDRKQFEEMRSQIPAEKRQQNDELAFTLNLMSDGQGQVKRPPSEIREKFDAALRKKRETFDKDISKERETFEKEERKKRDEFLKSQQQLRDQFAREKHSRDEKSEFSKDMDGKRTDFFATEREKRNDFESDIRDRRKNFEDYAREKNNEFNQEYRAYSRRYEDMKKTEQQKKTPSSGVAPGSNSEAEQLDQDLRNLENRQGTPLESGE